MAAQTQRMVLKEIVIEDPDQLFKPETGAQAEAIQSEREEIGKSQTCGSKNPFGLRRLEDATVILRRVKDPRKILSNVEGVSKVRMTINCCEVAAVAETHLKGKLEPINVNTEDGSKLAMAANSQECSVDIIRSGSLDSPELSFSMKQDSVAIVGLTNLQDSGKTQTCQCSSNMSTNLNSLKEGEAAMKNQNFSEKPAIISNLQDAITTSSTESSSDKSVTWNNLEGSMLTVSPNQLSSSLDAELHPGQSNEAYDLPTPVSMTTSPEDRAWWKHLPLGKECEAGDGNKDVDAEVMLNFSRLSDFEACSGICELELDSDLKGTKEMDNPRSSKKKPKRLRMDNTSKPRCPETSPDKGSAKKKRNCTRISPRRKRISGKTEESESKDAVESSKEEIRACKETEKSESKEVQTASEQESKAEIEDQDIAWDQLTLENEVLIDAICRPMSLRSRRTSVIKDVNLTCAKLALEESKAEPQLSDLSVKAEINDQSQCSVRKTDKKLRMKRPPLLHCDWLVGDLLWAKMAGHPWWPCMLTYDPSLGLYTRSSTVGKIIRTRYHVRFFGEKPYRAWIADGAILQYKGVTAFEQLCAQMMQTDLVHRSRDYYNIKESRRRAWDAAVEEAEKMSRLSRKERLLRCNSVNGMDSSKKSSVTLDGTGRSRKDRGKSISHDKMEQKTPERKRRRRSEPPVKVKSNAKDPLSPDESQKHKDRKEDQNGNCTKEESKPEVLKLCGSGGAVGGMRKGNVCLSCEKEVSEEELVSCEGSCLGSFHRMCLGLAVGLPTPFICDECTSGSHTCFICKVTSVETVRCSVSLCGRFYHLECVKTFRLAHVDKRRLQCPLHTCATCAADDIKNPLASKGSLLRCVRCPTAYHSSDFCLAPGSERLAGNAIVCSRHLVKSTSQQHVNVNWCFLCSEGGTLLCCESCPAAFHLDCLKIVTPPVGSWECEECTEGKRPLYGEIVWAKLGNYRWWPGEICHPRNIPDSLMGAPHKTGEFPVRFFGTHNYFWANIGRVFLFQEDDKGSRDSVRNGLDKSFSRAVQEANAAIRVWMAEKEKRDQRSKAKVDRKPPPYKHLKASTVVGNVSVHRFNLDDIHPCSCRWDMVDPCGPESKCLNRDLSYECHPDVCPVGNSCQNRRFQQREYVPVVPFKTENRGWGLKTLVDVKEGQFVIEYVGELIDHDESRRRMKEMQTRKNSSFYLLTLDKDRIIDAGPRGNVSRFMNHSCQPNCETQKWTVNGDSRIGLFSIIDIPAGSELTFNYNLDCLGNEKLACHCGSAICSGYLGLRPKQSTAVLSDSSKKKRKRRLKKSFERIHEDECFRCGKTGQLIMCDKSQCPKVYHLKCLHLTKAPHGKWICPWHHCDECGQPSTQLCNECDNSFCSEHIEGNIAEMFPGYLVCCEHDELKPANDPKLGLCGMEGCDSEFEKTLEGKLGSETKRKWRRSSLGICEKNANGKRKRKRERELSTDALIKSEGETKLLEMASATRKKMSPNTKSQSEDDLKLSRTGEKTSKNDTSCKRKRSGVAMSSTVSEKNSTRKRPTKRRQKSLPENQTHSEDAGECFGTESGKTSKVSSKRSRNRRQTIAVINFKGVTKLKRKIEESSAESITVDPIKTEDVAELSTVKTGEGNQKKKRNSRKSSLLVIPAKRAKTECTLESDHKAMKVNSIETGMKTTKESRRKSLKIKNTEEGTKFQKVLKKTVTGVGASKKESRISKKSPASLNSSVVVVQKASVVQKKKLARPQCSNFPLKISKTSKKNSTVLKYKSTCSKDLQKVLKANVSRTHHETEFHNDALKSSGRKLKLGEEQKSRKRGRKLKLGEEQKSRKRGRNLKRGEEQKRRKSGRFMKQSDNSDDRKMETEEETQITLTDVAQVEIEATEMASLKTPECSALLLDTPVTERIEIRCGSEKDVTHLEVTDEKSRTEEDSMILKIHDETLASPVKLTERKIVRKKKEGQRFGSGKKVMCKQSSEDKTGPRTETKNSEVNEDKTESQPKIQDLEIKNHSGLQIGAFEIGSQEDLSILTVKEEGMGSQKETENLEKISSHDLQTQVAIVKILDDSKSVTEGIISEIAKNIHNLPDSLTINRCNSKFKTDFYDTPSDSSESDGVLQVDGDFPAMKECKVWGKGTEQNYSESVSSSSRNGDERRIVLEANSNEPESDCHGTSVDVGSYVRLDRKKEECLADGQFPVVSEDVGVNAVMIDETQLVEILLPAESVGKTANVKPEAVLTNKDGLAGSSMTDVSSEMRTLPSVEDDNQTRSGIAFVREPRWKRNHKISSGNTSLNSKDGSSKDCNLFPRTY